MRDGTDHHGDVLDYLEGEKLCCGVRLASVLKMSGKGGDVREKRSKAKEPQQLAQSE